MEINVIKEIVESSTRIVNWSINLFGGSLLALLSTSYLRPTGKWSKLIYLIFIPAWVFLAYAIKYGDKISRRGLMASVKPELITGIEQKINEEFSAQLDCFNNSLLLFGLWLLLYLLWYIFNDFVKPKES